MRLLPALAVLLAGCGTVVPYGLAPGWLAPDLVPDATVSSVVVVDAAPGAAALVGRVLDGRTGAPLAGATVQADDAEAVTGADGRFVVAVSEGAVRVRVAAPDYVPVADALTLAGRTEVLVLLDREAADA
jgi:hypothetical protein